MFYTTGSEVLVIWKPNTICYYRVCFMKYEYLPYLAGIIPEQGMGDRFTR